MPKIYQFFKIQQYQQKQKGNRMISKIGRPIQHSPINKLYLKQLSTKEGVLQAQVDLILTLYQIKTMIKDIEVKDKPKNRKNILIEDIKARMGYLLNQKREDELYEIFSQVVEKYQFVDFELSTMPNEFYNWSLDLSYIFRSIDSLPTLKIPQMIFVGILCLWKRKYLSWSLLSTIDKNLTYLIDAVTYGIERVQLTLNGYEDDSYLVESNTNEDDDENDNGSGQVYNEDEVNQEINLMISTGEEKQQGGVPSVELNEVEADSLSQNGIQNNKTKKIKKPRKRTPKTAPQPLSQQSKIQLLKYGMLKTASYICNCYYYARLNLAQNNNNNNNQL